MDQDRGERKKMANKVSGLVLTHREKSDGFHAVGRNNLDEDLLGQELELKWRQGRQERLWQGHVERRISREDVVMVDRTRMGIETRRVESWTGGPAACVCLRA